MAGLFHHSTPQRVPVHPLRRRAGRLGHRAVGRTVGIPMTRAGREHHRPVQNRGHRPPGAMGNPRPGGGRHQRWASWYNTARVMRRTGGRPPANTSGLARRHTRPGARPRPGQQARRRQRRRPWPPRITQAGSARTRRGSAPDPALLRDAPAGQDGCGGRRASPRRRATGATTPAQVRPSASQAMTLSVTLTSPDPRAMRCPTRRCPPRPALPARHHQLQRSYKFDNKAIQPSPPPNTHPTRHLKSSLHQLARCAHDVACRCFARCRDKRPVVTSRRALASVGVRR